MEDNLRKDKLGYKETEFINSSENMTENEEILSEIKNKINNEIKNYYRSDSPYKPKIKFYYTYEDGVGIFAFEHQLYVYHNEREIKELYGPYNVEQALKVVLNLNSILFKEKIEYLEVDKNRKFYK